MQRLEAARLIRALKVMNKGIERIEKIVGKALSRSVNVGDKRTANLIVIKRSQLQYRDRRKG
jgi:hypothetical protein